MTPFGKNVMEPTAETLPVQVEVGMAASPGVRLSLPSHGEIHLSIEEARALSLALIAAVNRKEREQVLRHGPLKGVAPHSGKR
jgi:xanthine/CO dehydrogenase XdhC/CoxF family maturation factor